MTEGQKLVESLRDAIEFERAVPPDGFGRCPVPPGHHYIGAWDTSFTGGPEGVSCRRCHKTWIRVDGVFTATHEHNAAPQADGAEDQGEKR